MPEDKAHLLAESSDQTDRPIDTNAQPSNEEIPTRHGIMHAHGHAMGDDEVLFHIGTHPRQIS